MTNEIKNFQDINSKLILFEKCLNESGLYKNYPYIDKIDTYVLNTQKDLIRNCVKREKKKESLFFQSTIIKKFNI